MSNVSSLIEVARASKRGTSIRLTIPKQVAKRLELDEGQFIGFYQSADKIYIKKLQ